MKVTISLLFFFACSSSLQAKCYLHEVMGHLDIIDSNIVLQISEKTQSQKNLFLDSDRLLAVAPFIDRYIQTQIIIETNEIYNNTKILEIKHSKLTPYDPLNDVAPLTKKLIKEVACP